MPTGEGAGDMSEHPAFTRAKALPEPLRAMFPHTVEEAKGWKPHTRTVALASRVLVVMRTRVECAWAAYIDAVPGHNHDHEEADVLTHGTKLLEKHARFLFPEMKDVPYAH